MKEQAEANGYQVLGQGEWLLADTTFSTQVREMRRANPDIVAISAHPFTTCGALKEMERQGVKPKLLIGLTSSSSIETLQGCAKQAEGIIIPTSFAPVTPEANKAAENVAKFGGSADLHSAAAYEIMFILKDVIEQQKIMAKPDTVAADRVKMREGLAALKETMGLLGKVGRAPIARRSSRSSTSMPRTAAGSSCTSRRPDRLTLDECLSRLAGMRSRQAANVDLLDLIDAVQSLADGVLFGATYALLGIGFTLVFGVMHKINLSYRGRLDRRRLCEPADPRRRQGAAGAGLPRCRRSAGGVIGALVYLIGFRFIPLANPLATLMSTVGLLLLIDEIIVHTTQGVPLNYPALFSDVIIRAGPFNLRGDLMFVFALGCVCMVLLLALLYRTRLGPRDARRVAAAGRRRAVRHQHHQRERAHLRRSPAWSAASPAR